MCYVVIECICVSIYNEECKPFFAMNEWIMVIVIYLTFPPSELRDINVQLLDV